MLENSVKNGSSPTTGVAVRAKVLYFGTCCESTLLVTKIQPAAAAICFSIYNVSVWVWLANTSSCTVRLSLFTGLQTQLDWTMHMT